MTLIAEPVRTTPTATDDAASGQDGGATEDRPELDPVERAAPLRLAPLILGWLLITVVGVAVALLAIGPISEDRDQRALLTSYRAEIESASNEAFGLAGIEVPTQAPAAGAPVGIIDIERIGLSRVVVEGTRPEKTRQGPGHVVGTGGLGQPGNSVVVARRNLFGGAFADLGMLEAGDRILVTTDQGRSVYVVDHVGTHEIVTDPDPGAEATTSTTSTPPGSAPLSGPVTTPDGAEGPGVVAADRQLGEGPVTAEQVFGPSPDDRLTLVTSAPGTSAIGSDAVVVIARMESQPFEPTPQGGRTPDDDGRSGSSDGTAALLLALIAYAAAVAATVWLHRTVPWRSAYLLSAPLLVALTIVLADEVASLLPAWS